MSGSFNAGVLSPPAATIPHGTSAAGDNATTLNKDNNTRSNHTAAFNAAVKQTQHEWCRMLNLTKAKHGISGASLAMALMVDPSKSPHPAGTPCHDATPTTKSVYVEVKSIKVFDDTDFTGAGEMNFMFVVYTDDFARSTRTEVTKLSIDTGDTVPGGSLPGALTLGVKSFNDVVITIQSWDDENVTAAFDGVFDDTDEVLRGVTLDFSAVPFKVGKHKVSSSQLEVTFNVSIIQIPEPSSVCLAILGAIGLLCYGCFQKSGTRSKERA